MDTEPNELPFFPCMRYRIIKHYNVILFFGISGGILEWNGLSTPTFRFPFLMKESR